MGSKKGFEGIRGDSRGEGRGAEDLTLKTQNFLTI